MLDRRPVNDEYGGNCQGDRQQAGFVVQPCDCWRCGGVGHCTNCKGSGQGSLGMYGTTPAECWICAESGECPECDGTGFSVYEGVLPKAYTAWGREAGFEQI